MFFICKMRQFYDHEEIHKQHYVALAHWTSSDVQDFTWFSRACFSFFLLPLYRLSGCPLMLLFNGWAILYFCCHWCACIGGNLWSTCHFEPRTVSYVAIFIKWSYLHYSGNCIISHYAGPAKLYGIVHVSTSGQSKGWFFGHSGYFYSRSSI